MSRVIRTTAIVAGAATLAACAQTPYTAQRASFRDTAMVRQAAIEYHRPHRTRVVTASVVRRKPAAEPSERQTKSHGIASFYSDTKTASGEKFNPQELTAAHPSLPFGTKLRVTNVSTGQSVTVRVNDRGPYVPGRVVDVSYSAAEALGMVGKGVAPVKLDVVQ